MPTHILVDPLGWGELRKLKVGSAYNSTLLGAGTNDAEQRLLGLPVIVDPAVPDYSGVVVDRRAVVSAVGCIKVASSEHEYFSSDSVLLRATWRTGYVVVRPNRIGKFAITPAGSRPPPFIHLGAVGRLARDRTDSLPAWARPGEDIRPWRWATVKADGSVDFWDDDGNA